MNFYERLIAIVGEENVLSDEPMMNHVTFKVGGPARYYVIPQTMEALAEVIRMHKEEGKPYAILGKGSNLLVRDEGYEGTVIQILSNLSAYHLEGPTLTAEAGVMLGKLANVLLEQELAGFEFASGIPGTLGGAVTMNAGAYGGEMKDVIKSVKVLDQEGNIKVLQADELELGYRSSIIAKKGLVVLEAVMEFTPGRKEEIEARMKDFNGRRREKQPLEYPSAGSTFKRPKGYFAGKLIQDAGLKGYSVGGAQVSEKHSGFVINTGDATCSDILQLIADVKDTVWDKFGVKLEEEVKILE